MASHLGDWALVVVVIVLVIAVYLAVAHTIDTMLDYWRAHKEDA